MSNWGKSNFGNSSFGKSNFNTWDNSYNSKNSKSFNSYYDENYSSKKLSDQKSWNYNFNTYQDSDKHRRDNETGRKVTAITKSDGSVTYCLHQHDGTPGETKRNGKTVKKWKDNK